MISYHFGFIIEPAPLGRLSDYSSPEDRVKVKVFWHPFTVIWI